MRIQDALNKGEIPRSEIEILLSSILKKDKTWVIAHNDSDLNEQEMNQLDMYINRRKDNEPIAYITGEKEFYERPFIVTNDVLVPRPSTEYLIEATMKFINNKESKTIDADTDIVIWSKRYSDTVPTTIVDIGTGSGCIAITLAYEFPKLNIIATDISKNALRCAEQNIKKHNMESRIKLREGDGISAVSGLTEPFVLVSNPPYIPKNEEVQIDVSSYEPHIALFSGSDGGDLIKELIYESNKNPYCVGFCMECRTDHVTI
ncbi:peptide chain release factor N(5)-glutamine methyltransferase [Candidatus Peregrinibacteria bacterium]|jgi:release factor glutamine methyltransferase|nr:peptide chain release factor N(5)-glutamine methyltransferase [Candidatus Peregrinibacteria bacterium]MBT3598360.1 peptide chain release factor N(5)-glutamine methyltransferase [Candidatus Peregrinibacteria bacterium]MBT4367354.1 peptide chain release factor N(5)-glutamine methyltransferase [Candidatus Peregrinibacteria bacterium]MBT4585540.1 peptide chain release factor N(5)-glutamine methyltransferase [Candidatus Peregrinibacteria bacterium]MBT6731355.1 peptide chain release factor N(5)-gl